MIRSPDFAAGSSPRRRFLRLTQFVLPFLLAAPHFAQTEATVAALGPLLAAEDARRFDAAVLRQGLGAGGSPVRRSAAGATGRARGPPRAPRAGARRPPKPLVPRSAWRPPPRGTAPIELSSNWLTILLANMVQSESP